MSMTRFHVAAGLSLPEQAVTETFAVLGRRGSGKTYTAGVLVEELLEAKHQVVILDPLDVWWGLRASADGKGDGYPVTIFGGQKADVPLQESAGALLADVVIEHGISAILSLRHLSKAGARRFVAAFADRLYERKGETKHRSPLHLVVDEADAFVPQHLSNDATSCYGAIDTIVRRGRSSGFGTTLISQRSAVIAKDVLTQTEVLVAHQTTGPQDRKALEAWIEAHDTGDRKADFLASLASLPRGTAWWWSPGWLDFFKKVETREKRTFDSSSTPRGGERTADPKRMTPVDLEVLSKRIAATVEEAKASDPRELRATIADLRRQLAAKPDAAPKVERVEVPVLSKQDRQRLANVRGWLETLNARGGEIGRYVASTARTLAEIQQRICQIEALPSAHPPTSQSTATERPALDRPPLPVELPAPRARKAGAVCDGALTHPQRRILNTVAMLVVRGVAPTRTSIAAWLDLHPNGGSYSTNLALLRQTRCLDGFSLTDFGQSIAEPGETGHNAALAAVTRPQALILRALSAAHRPLDRASLAHELDLHPNGGSFSTNLARLRTMGLITERGPIATTEALDR